ncbi:response regulator transcription factor [Streptomyces sp. NPDC057101]|uniref:response regulator transcription factor n=1 Tax=Streptomyces sp. NPDC057101 TaxID=3346020 RepID=UPI00363CED06
MPRVLLIEDDPALREGVELGLGRRGHEVRSADTGEAGLAALNDFRPHLLLLDLMLPGMNGIQVCQRIRENSQLPIILFTARGEDFDIVVGLESGADDYIVKPARTEVIDARIRAVLRRSVKHQGQGEASPEVHGSLTIDRTALSVTKHGRRLDLAATEMKLLLHLSAAPCQVFSRQQLLEQVWGHDHHGDGRLVDACVKRLRHKMEEDAASPRYVQTLRGFGYRFGPV